MFLNSWLTVLGALSVSLGRRSHGLPSGAREGERGVFNLQHSRGAWFGLRLIQIAASQAPIDPWSEGICDLRRPKTEFGALSKRNADGHGVGCRPRAPCVIEA